MKRIITIYNEKGGVGKTTTAVNISASLALKGFNTLLIDCDHQGSAAAASGRHTLKSGKSISDAFLNKQPFESIITSSCMDYLKVVPPPRSAFMNELSAVSFQAKRSILRNMLENIGDKFDYIIIDTAPSLNLFTINAITASHRILIPLQCEYLAFRNLQSVFRILKAFKTKYHTDLKLMGILLTMVDESSTLSNRIVKSARANLTHRIFKTTIPRNADLRDSTFYQKPLVISKPESRGGRSYSALTNEIVAKMKNG